MKPATFAAPDLELVRLEIQRICKMRFGRDPEFNASPFSTDAVTRYDTNVAATDVPLIHGQVRECIDKTIKEIHQGQVSQVVILTGDPGSGKTHLNQLLPRLVES